MLPEVYDAIEAFAGVGNLTACLRAAGLTVAALEITDWGKWLETRTMGSPSKLRCKSNPLDLLSPSGMACLGIMYFRFWFDFLYVLYIW